MPVYDYLCPYCGPFTDMAPMVQFAEPMDCPECGEAAPRALLSMPHFRGMETSRFSAHAANERSANAPETSAKSGKHPKSCTCCSKQASTGAARSFPGTRPWMISH